MAEAVAAVDYLPQVRPKVAVSMHRKLLSAARMSPFTTRSSEREELDAAGNERPKALGAVAPPPDSEPQHETCHKRHEYSPQERRDDQQVGRTVARGLAGVTGGRMWCRF